MRRDADMTKCGLVRLAGGATTELGVHRDRLGAIVCRFYELKETRETPRWRSRKPGQLGRVPFIAARAFDEAAGRLWCRFDDFDLNATAARSRCQRAPATAGNCQARPASISTRTAREHVIVGNVNTAALARPGRRNPCMTDRSSASSSAIKP
jgi:hypothetical protein